MNFFDFRQLSTVEHTNTDNENGAVGDAGYDGSIGDDACRRTVEEYVIVFRFQLCGKFVETFVKQKL